jgi:hypothetical protein
MTTIEIDWFQKPDTSFPIFSHSIQLEIQGLDAGLTTFQINITFDMNLNFHINVKLCGPLFDISSPSRQMQTRSYNNFSSVFTLKELSSQGLDNNLHRLASNAVHCFTYLNLDVSLFDPVLAQIKQSFQQRLSILIRAHITQQLIMVVGLNAYIPDDEIDSIIQTIRITSVLSS